MAVSMDGFHFTRAALSAMPDPENAHARRGAAFTFDAERYLEFVKGLRGNASEDLWAPTFDHAVKDPKEGDLLIAPVARIVIVEGNYVALDQPVWRDAASIYDELWFVDVDFEVARKRLRERHLRAGIVQTLDDGDKRARENDLPNGEVIVANRMPVAEVLESLEDEEWVHE
jgi:pantothenate kinase